MDKLVLGLQYAIVYWLFLDWFRIVSITCLKWGNGQKGWETLMHDINEAYHATSSAWNSFNHIGFNLLWFSRLIIKPVKLKSRSDGFKPIDVIRFDFKLVVVKYIYKVFLRIYL